MSWSTCIGRIVVWVSVALSLPAACSGGGGGAAVKHECSAGPDGCYCSAFLNGPDPTSTIECSPAKFPGTRCCADVGWPDAPGHSTGCQCTTPAAGGTFACAPGTTEVSGCD